MADLANKLLYCSLLALQYGLQPFLTARFTATGVSRASIVLAVELGKIVIVILSCYLSAAQYADFKKAFLRRTLWESLRDSAAPAVCYAIQNLLLQHGYLYLDSMTFNIINQTKTISAAFCLWLLLGYKQSAVQIFSLFLLLAAAVVLNFDQIGHSATTNDSQEQEERPYYSFGLLMVSLASLLSGVSAALSQRALKNPTSNSLFFSGELAVYGLVFLMLNLSFNSDVKQGDYLFSHWDIMTLLPVLTNACGGLVVGMVMKYAGGIMKGFSLIVGIIITALAQAFVDGTSLGMKEMAGVLLVSVSIYLHSSFPLPKEKSSSPAAVVEFKTVASKSELNKEEEAEQPYSSLRKRVASSPAALNTLLRRRSVSGDKTFEKVPGGRTRQNSKEKRGKKNE